MAATVPVDTQGDAHPLVEEAQRIGVTPDENQQDNTPQQTAAVDPKPGSFEAFMSSFGSPRRWAGR